MLKKPFKKRTSGVAQSVGPEFKPQCCPKKKKKKTIGCMFHMIPMLTYQRCIPPPQFTALIAGIPASY
jgi:hypothetical protein